jgi:hypothetical protein
MDVRDRARSDLYLAQLRSQSAPNTPGFGPLSPSYSQHAKSPRFPPTAYNSNSQSAAEDGFAGTRFIEANSTSSAPAKPFQLQPPPIKIHSATPKTPQNGFEPTIRPQERKIDHVDAAPGEQQYATVPIPGAYTTVTSPGPNHTRFGSVGEAITSDQRIESPPGSPRGWKQ